MRGARRALALAALVAVLLLDATRSAHPVVVSGSFIGTAVVPGDCPTSEANKVDFVQVKGVSAANNSWVFTVTGQRMQTSSLSLQSCSGAGIGAWSGTWNPAGPGCVGGFCILGSTGSSLLGGGTVGFTVQFSTGLSMAGTLVYGRAGGTTDVG